MQYTLLIYGNEAAMAASTVPPACSARAMPWRRLPRLRRFARPAAPARCRTNRSPKPRNSLAARI
jgi:hypothetical protein